MSCRPHPALRPWKAFGVLLGALTVLTACPETGTADGTATADTAGSGRTVRPLTSSRASAPPASAAHPGPSGQGAAEASSGAAEPTTSAEERSDGQRCTPPDGSAAPLELVKFQFTSGVEDRKPVDDLERAKPNQRVWAYLTVRNPSSDERCVTVEFRLNGKRRSRVSLSVGSSPHWRTWARTNVAATDAPGHLNVVVVDDLKNKLAKRRLPIAAGD